MKKPFELIGDSYKRPLIKEQNKKIAIWYNRKGLTVMATSHHIAKA